MKLSMFQDWLAQRSPREQTGIRAALLLVGVLLVWRIGVAPGLQVWSMSETRQVALTANSPRCKACNKKPNA